MNLLVFLAGPSIEGNQNTKSWSGFEVLGSDKSPPELLKLAEEFLSLLGLRSGIPNYAAIGQKQKEQLRLYRARLDSLDMATWPVHFKDDHLIFGSEIGALDPDFHVWRPTSQNLYFYADKL